MENNDIDYTRTRLLDELDMLAIPDDLRSSVSSLLSIILEDDNSLQETLNTYTRSKEKKLVLERRRYNGNESSWNR